MHATIQKPLNETIGYLKDGERVFIVGCGNCATKWRSGREEQVKDVLLGANKQAVEEANSFLALARGQGVHTVLDASGGKLLHPGCETIFGGETVTPQYITEYCSLCGECLVEYTGGPCPLILCTKGLLNGPCGGVKNGKCEADPERDCGWQLIYERLKSIGRLDLMYQYDEPKDYSKWSRPRSLSLEGNRAQFSFVGGDFA